MFLINCYWVGVAMQFHDERSSLLFRTVAKREHSTLLVAELSGVLCWNSRRSGKLQFFQLPKNSQNAVPVAFPFRHIATD